jgi:hypothetical protein
MKRLTLFLLLIALPFSAFSIWNTDPTVRNPVTTAPGTQSNPRACSDGQGGVIITWLDQFKTVYAQRITKNGTPLWGANGVAIFKSSPQNSVKDPSATSIVADGAGGGIIFYEGSINGGAFQIYARHVDAIGNMWPNPVKITDLPSSLLRWSDRTKQVGLSADGNGGAFITWQSYGSANGFIFAQHISKDGFLAWGSTGVAMPFINNQNGRSSSIVNTGNGTAVVAYHDGDMAFIYNAWIRTEV